MGKKIIWRKKALKNVDKIMEYLSAEWGKKITLDFSEHLVAQVEYLSQYPDLGTKSLKNDVFRKFLLTKHSYLIYIVGKKTISIVDVQDTRQNPENAKY